MSEFKLKKYNFNQGSFNFRIGIDGQFWNWNCLFKKIGIDELELKFATKK